MHTFTKGSSGRGGGAARDDALWLIFLLDILVQIIALGTCTSSLTSSATPLVQRTLIFTMTLGSSPSVAVYT